jgi:hypothetical protein
MAIQQFITAGNKKRNTCMRSQDDKLKRETMQVQAPYPRGGRLILENRLEMCQAGLDLPWEACEGLYHV